MSFNRNENYDNTLSSPMPSNSSSTAKPRDIIIRYQYDDEQKALLRRYARHCERTVRQMIHDKGFFVLYDAQAWDSEDEARRKRDQSID